MQVTFYGALADAIDRQVEADVPDGCSIGDLRRRLSVAHPRAAAELRRARAVIGDRAVMDEHVTRAVDCVEFLPPVSGG